MLTAANPALHGPCHRRLISAHAARDGTGKQLSLLGLSPRRLLHSEVVLVNYLQA